MAYVWREYLQKIYSKCFDTVMVPERAIRIEETPTEERAQTRTEETLQKIWKGKQ